MGGKLFEIGWLLTKYITIPILVIVFSILLVIFIIEVVKQVRKELK